MEQKQVNYLKLFLLNIESSLPLANSSLINKSILFLEKIEIVILISRKKTSCPSSWIMKIVLPMSHLLISLSQTQEKHQVIGSYILSYHTRSYNNSHFNWKKWQWIYIMLNRCIDFNYLNHFLCVLARRASMNVVNWSFSSSSCHFGPKFIQKMWEKRSPENLGI